MGTSVTVILDTNIFLSALLSPYGPPNTIYRAWRAGRFTIVTSKIQLTELRKASRYPKFKKVLQPHRMMINNLNRAIVLERLPTVNIVTDDPDDTFLLAMATASKAEYLVTGDYRAGLLRQKRLGPTRILTPAIFCTKVL